MWGVADPSLVGLIASFARPGGNVTGVSFAFGTDVYSKELQLLKETVPTIRRVAVLSNSANPGHAPALNSVRAAAQSLGVSLQSVEVTSQNQFDAAFMTIAKERAEALLVVPDSFFGMHSARLADLASHNRLPSMFGIRGGVDAGGLMSYGPNLTYQMRQAAAYVDQDPERREACRPARRAADEVRAGNQSQDCESTRSHDPAVGAAACG
jgi:putative ABC transport system substrate-binding protein